MQLNKDIYKIKPGLYGLISHRKLNETKGIFEETDKNKDSKEIAEFNHSYYQGLILTIGNLKNFQTFLPHQDKNRLFINEKLADISTLDKIPLYSYENLVKRSATIDVIWFNERKMPHSFFEVEHSTDIQNSLLKFNDLQDFSSRMFVVADKKRKSEFETKLNYAGLEGHQIESAVFRLRNADETIRTSHGKREIFGCNLMKKFIFITKEGETIAPNGSEVNNLQVIGIVENVENEDEALKKLLQRK